MRRRLPLLLLLALLLCPSESLAQPNAWINEFHYDNIGTDVNEFVEVIVLETFTDLDRLAVILYNGNGGTSYNMQTLSGFLEGDTEDGFTLYYFTYSTNGIQNGDADPDGMALCYDSNDDGTFDVVVTSGSTAQFLSYEGSFTANSGCAAGLTSTDIGHSESGSTPSDASLGLTGTGDDYDDFMWVNFTLNTKGSSNLSQLLPVELVAFTALVDGRTVLLRWETASETNNAGFDIQHRMAVETVRATSLPWETLAFVDGYGTTERPQSYAYRLENLLPGRHRFRLKQIDFDGTVEYSPEVEVAVAVPGAYHLSKAYPNPFYPKTSFSISVVRAQHVEVAVYDLQGRRVAWLYDGPLEAGTTRAVTFTSGALPSGLYLIRIRGEYFTAGQAVVLAK